MKKVKAGRDWKYFAIEDVISCDRRKYIGRTVEPKGYPIPLHNAWKFAKPIFTIKSWGTKGYK